MESPGEYLRREREHRGVSLLKIFESTRVPMKYLEAIEEDRLEGLPHPTFVKGYIRSYCKVLGVDENDAVLRFEVWLSEKTAEAQEAGTPKTIQEIKKAKAASAKPSREIKLPANLGKAAVVAAGIIVVVLAYALTKRDLSAPEQVIAPAPAIEASAEPAASTEAVPAPVAESAPEPPQTNVSSVNTQKTIAPAPIAAPQAAPQAAAKPLQQVKPLQQAPSAPEKAPQAEPEKKEATPANGAVAEPPKNHVLTASARDMVWLKVGVDKQEPVEVLLKQGERFTWTASDNISVIIGNAGGVTLTYNGKAISGLGSSGEVVGLKLPSGASYKIKTPQPQAEVPEPKTEPQMAPAVNMPEIPSAAPVGAQGE